MSSYREKEENFINKEIEFLNILDISDNDMAAVKMSIREAYREGFFAGEDYGCEKVEKRMKLKMESLLEKISMEFERVKS
ncbi:hypothetical protein [Paenibacillus polymyxa]|uniref:hypothetical protein n=1 Tax=Paenibacillus polymyxa TaxID=1406 RepID=UPI003D29B175